MPHPLWALAFALLGSAILGDARLIAGIWADKFDQLAAFQNFLIMPLTFLSGVFYSIHSLPPFWQALSHFNPFFYMIDGFRYGFFGLSDVAPVLSLALVAAAARHPRCAGVAHAGARLEIAALNRRYAAKSLQKALMVTPDSIKTSIEAGIACEAIDVTGDGQHFEALIVSDAFRGLSRLARHRLVYAALGDRMSNTMV